MTLPIRITTNALTKVSTILNDYFEQNGIQGYLELSIVQKGCSGLSYNMNIINQPNGDKDILLENKLIIKANSLLFLINTEIDYKIDDTSAGFVFKNPNEKRSCHCGAAFYV